MINHEAADAVIVGAGAAGTLLAAKLAQGGKRVVVLEAGPPWQLRDLYSSEIWARRLKWAAAPVPSTGSDPISVGYNVGGGFGGSALHHYAAWWRLHPEDFKERSLFGVSQDWPITYDDLRPYYDQVQAEVGISGDAEAETTRPPGDPYPMPPLAAFGQNRVLARGADALGIGHFPLPVAINSVPYKGRNACLLDGWCDAGCPIGALANPLVINMGAALQAGAEFRPHARVAKVLTDPKRGGLASGVTYKDRSGADHYQPAGVVILASFAVETPRILLSSATGNAPAGLANSSGAVGQYLTSHISPATFGLFEEDTEPYRGVVAGSFASQDSYDKQNGDYFGSYTLIGASSFKPNDIMGLANTRPDLFGAALDAFLRQAANHIAITAAIGEAQPQAQNQVTLSSQTDAFGLSLAQVTHAFSENDRRLAAAAASEGLAILKAAGATQTWQGQPATVHMVGGAIMGSDPAASVTNGYGQTHDVANLFVAGTPLFPTVGGVNPTFTVYALASRTAEYLLGAWEAIARPV